MNEKEFREVVKRSVDRIEKHFEDVDPDVVECSVQFGALTLLFSDKSKFILSSQPSVSQIWVAVAAKGIAIHFNYDQTSESWIDDKGKGIELHSFLNDFIKEKTGLILKK